MSNYTRKYGPSPFHQWSNAAIVASATQHVSFEDDMSGSEKYLPFDLLIVTNNSGEPIKVWINGNPANKKYVPNGQTQTYDRGSVPAVRSVTIENVGTGTAAAGTIFIEAQKEGVKSDSIIQRAHAWLFGG